MPQLDDSELRYLHKLVLKQKRRSEKRLAEGPEQYRGANEGSVRFTTHLAHKLERMLEQ